MGTMLLWRPGTSYGVVVVKGDSPPRQFRPSLELVGWDMPAFSTSMVKFPKSIVSSKTCLG